MTAVLVIGGESAGLYGALPAREFGAVLPENAGVLVAGEMKRGIFY